MTGPKKSTEPPVLDQRRKALRLKFGDQPSDYPPAILQELADGPLLDARTTPLPAGRLTMEELRRREARNASAGATPRTKQE